MIDTSRIHQIGAERHKGLWLFANQRAIEVLWGSALKPEDPDVKATIPRIVLVVLDALMVQRGNRWDAVAKRWVLREVPA